MVHPSGVSGGQLEAWLESCRKDGGYTFAEMQDGKRNLRDSGRIACTNGIWWIRDLPQSYIENTNHERAIRREHAKQRRERKP